MKTDTFPQTHARKVKSCRSCALRSGCKAPVPPQFPDPEAGSDSLGWGTNGIFLLGEAPGADEDSFAEPFVGQSGKLLDGALTRANIERRRCTIANVVRCRPPGNRTPEPDETAACFKHLNAEFGFWLGDWDLRVKLGVWDAHSRPVLITLGVTAFNSARDMLESEVEETGAGLRDYRGIPILARFDGIALVWIPLNHPAPALRLPDEITSIYNGIALLKDRAGLFQRARLRFDRREEDKENRCFDWLYADSPDGRAKEKATCYRHVNGEDVNLYVDTETVHAQGAGEDEEEGDRLGAVPWSAQVRTEVSGRKGPVFFYRIDDAAQVRRLSGMAGSARSVTLHNAMFDIAVLRRAGVDITDPKVFGGQIHDSMIAADVMQTHPRGLKPLGLRLGAIAMKSYNSVVGPTARRLATEYIDKVVACAATPAGAKWANKCVEPERVPETGEIRWKSGHSIVQRAGRLKKDMDDPVKGPDTDPIARWGEMPDTQRRQVARVLGPMPSAGLADVPFADALYYSCLDAEVTARVWEALWGELNLPPMAKVKDTYLLDMAVLPLVVEMERNGLLIDIPALDAAEKMLLAGMKVIEDKIEKIAGRYVNIGSPNQTAWLIFDHQKVPEFNESKKNLRRTTDDKWLDKIWDKSPVIPMVQEWRGLNKLVTSYCRPVREGARRREDGRLRARLSPTGTKTGRMTANDPNVLSVPKKDDEEKGDYGILIKRAVVAQPGYVILEADYSQVELRLFAHETREPSLLDSFLKGVDMHATTASKMFRCALSAVTKAMRQKGKTVNFGIIYGIMKKGLSRQLTSKDEVCTEAMAQSFIDGYFAGYTRVRPWMDEVIALTEKRGYAEDMFGRRRMLGGIWSPDKQARGEAERQACNAMIQMAASGVIKRAMREIIHYVRDFNARYGEGSVLALLQVHDALVWEVREEIAREWGTVLKEVMEGVVTISVPLLAEVSWGPNWADQTKMEEEKK